MKLFQKDNLIRPSRWVVNEEKNKKRISFQEYRKKRRPKRGLIWNIAVLVILVVIFLLLNH